MKSIDAKHLPSEKNLRRYILIGLLIYLLVLAAVLASVVLISISDHDRMEMILQEEGEIYLQEGRFKEAPGGARNAAAFYDVEGNLVELVDRNPKGFDAAALFTPLVRRSMAEGYVTRFGFSPRIDRFFYFACAEPLYEGNTLKGFLCSYQEIQSLFMWMVTAFLLVTFVAGVALSSVLVLYHNNEKTRNLRNSYIANVSHSLKSPIASIRAIAETMSDGLVTDPNKIQDLSSLILSEAASLEKTVMDIMELSRLQNKTTDFSKHSVTAEELFSPAIAKYSVLCDDIGVTFHAPHSKGIPVMWTNRERMQTLLDVLLDNALKFVRADGDIWLEVQSAPTQVTVTVRDNGIGMSREVQSHIFERFYMGDASHNERGSGLGLSIARNIVIGLDEKLWVSSSPGEGSSFYFTIHTAHSAAAE